MLPPYYAQRSQASNSKASKSGPAMSEAEADSMLSSLAKNVGGAVQTLGMALDTPGAIARGFLAGDPYSGFSWDADRRVTGDELLESYGIAPENKYLRTAAGLATEIATDPLTWMTGPLEALGRAGKAAKEVDLLSLAPIAAQRKMGARAADTMTGRYTRAALDALDPSVRAINEVDTVRPLVGQRLAQSQTTLRDLIDVAPDPTKAIEDLTTNLSAKGLSFDDVADENLGGLFGLGFIESDQAFMPQSKLAETALDALDLAGQKIGWSAPGRYASALFDRSVEGATDVGGQMLAMRHSKEMAKRRAAGQQLAAEHVRQLVKTPLTEDAKQLLGADSLLSEQGNSLFLRISENQLKDGDDALRQLIPDLDDAYASWDKIRRHNLDSAKALGLNLEEYQDAFGTLYSPRSGSAFRDGEYGDQAASLMNMRVEHAMARNPMFAVPGGTDTLREISLLPEVRTHFQQGDNSPYTHEQVGQVIKDFIDGRFGPDLVEPAQTTSIAKSMWSLKKELPDDYPAFAEHPINMQAQNIVSESVRQGNASFVYDVIAEAASPINANNQVGGGYKSVQAGLSDIAGKVGLRTGEKGKLATEVMDNIKGRLAQKMGTTPDLIDLNNVSVPENLIDRLGRIQDFYSSPRAQQELTGLFDKFTNLTKSFLLSWPSRHTRDAYSNLFSVWLEAGNAEDVYRGYEVAANVLAGDWDKALPGLRQLPQYRGVVDDDLIKSTVAKDVGRTSILMGISQDDYLTSNRLGAVQRLVPGAQPMALTDAVDAFKGTNASDYLQIRGITNELPTRNPILNASEAINNYNDALARLGGMFALMRQGATADYAAQRMRASLVDYQSLTTFETTLKKIFPWYSYQSRIGKYVVESMMRNPGGRYGQSVRAMNTLQASDDETYVPSSLRQQFAFRVPDELTQALGKPAGQDTTTFISDFDLPGIDTISLVAPGSMSDTFSNFALQTNPFIKTFIEQSTGRDLFSKRPLRQADTGADRIYKAITGDTFGLSPAAKAFIQNIPGTQRPVNFIGGLLDQRIPSFQQRLAKQAFNATTGFKITDVDPAWQLQDARNNNLRGYENYTQEFTTRYMSDDAKEVAPPEVMRAADLEKVLARRYKEYRQKQGDRPKQTSAFDALQQLMGG